MGLPNATPCGRGGLLLPGKDELEHWMHGCDGNRRSIDPAALAAGHPRTAPKRLGYSLRCWPSATSGKKPALLRTEAP